MADITIGVDTDTSGWRKGFQSIGNDVKGWAAKLPTLLGGGAGGAGGALGGGFGLNKFLSSDLAQSYASSKKLGITDTFAPAILRHLDEARTDVGYAGEGASAKDAQTIRRMADAARMGDINSAITLQRAGFGSDMDALVEAPHMALAARSAAPAYLPDMDRSFQRRALDEMGLSHIHQGDLLGFQRRAADRLNIDGGGPFSMGDTAGEATARELWEAGQGTRQLGTWLDRITQKFEDLLLSPLSNIGVRSQDDNIRNSGEELRKKWELMPNE